MEPNTLRISEIYETIQGESTAQGVPCLMIRLTGCPLRCSWCDSEYTFSGGNKVAFNELFESIEKSTAPMVEITGGEPLAQRQVIPFMEKIIAGWKEKGAKRKLFLETSGALDVSNVPKEVHKIIDIKCPSSGEEDKNLWTNFAKLTENDEIKCVVADENDYLWACSKLEDLNVHKMVTVLFSPVHGSMPLDKLADLLMKQAPKIPNPFRMQIQLHRIVWPTKNQGV